METLVGGSVPQKRRDEAQRERRPALHPTTLPLRGVRLLLGATALILPVRALADDSQLWAVDSVTVKLSNKWALSEEDAFRFSDNRHGLYEIEANTLLGYRLNKTVALWAGYTHDPNYSRGHLTWSTGRASKSPSIISRPWDPAG